MTFGSLLRALLTDSTSLTVAAGTALVAVEVMLARQLSYFAAREKDAYRRCDLEAGMAKLLAARVAWANADPRNGHRSRTRLGS